MTEYGKKNDGLTLATGGALGFSLAALLRKPSPSDSDGAKLDYISGVLDQLLVAVKAIVIPGGGDGGVVPNSILTPWKGDKDPIQLYQQVIRSVGVFQSDSMIDMRNVKRLAIRAESSLDQAVAIQLIGSFWDSFGLAVNIGLPAACPVNGQVGFGLAWGDWQPYIGVLITAAVAPTIGQLTIWAAAQE